MLIQMHYGEKPGAEEGRLAWINAADIVWIQQEKVGLRDGGTIEIRPGTAKKIVACLTSQKIPKRPLALHQLVLLEECSKDTEAIPGGRTAEELNESLKAVEQEVADAAAVRAAQHEREIAKAAITEALKEVRTFRIKLEELIGCL